ncbi:MAG: Gfo/Idh/MocA family oxidoreductase [Lentisphaerae bacterium]|jgi:predicted dehydrogenase|nr:Gfo/Idh/MocA family oxidoreductase [Lentisphaerota bacterium]MBT4820048.1 Gfo/Idh/MocA family oxidoreductase [Lentisphaerota bacterium]MBT5613187.1 Gfo/Idh/MocA family oxidoreductase [Lentisphaerota bacterium]MBT7843682.1 Gfo/Idh/MocA family oxidoreductase [Lentisphaerota bacterium]
MSKQLQAILVGCGSICNAWLKGIKESDAVAIVGLVDLDEDQSVKVAEAHDLQDVPRGTDMVAMIQQVAPDAVFDCTIPEAHFTVTTTALAHGCHVLGEKPLADTMDNAQAMVRAAQDAGLTYAVIQNRRYQDAIRSIRACLDRGTIGNITTVNADFYLGAHFGGFRDRMEHVLLLDMAIHTFDQGRLLSGADPVSVYCHEWNPAGSWYDHDASAHCIFQMTDGLVFNYRGSWCSEGLNTTWECDWRIVGDKGSITWNGGNQIHCEVVKKTGGFISETEAVDIPIETPEGMYQSHKGVIMEFVRCIREGTAPETVCTDNVKSLAMVFGAIESAESGRKVDITV